MSRPNRTTANSHPPETETEQRKNRNRARPGIARPRVSPYRRLARVFSCRTTARTVQNRPRACASHQLQSIRMRARGDANLWVLTLLLVALGGMGYYTVTQLASVRAEMAESSSSMQDYADKQVGSLNLQWSDLRASELKVCWQCPATNECGSHLIGLSCSLHWRSTQPPSTLPMLQLQPMRRRSMHCRLRWRKVPKPWPSQ